MLALNAIRATEEYEIILSLVQPLLKAALTFYLPYSLSWKRPGLLLRGPSMPSVLTLNVKTISECLNWKALPPQASTQLMPELKSGAARVVQLSLSFMVIARQLNMLGNFCLRASCLCI